MKILIVEDRQDSRKMLRAILESRACKVLEAGDGLEGLEMARDFRPDVVLSDALMPKMDGFQLLMELKRDKGLSSIPFIFLTGDYTGEKDAALALSLGAVAFLRKPVAQETIWKTIESAVSSSPLAPQGQSRSVDTLHLHAYANVVAHKLEDKIADLKQEIGNREKAEQRLRTLSRNLHDRLEQERRHIARELHDEIGQALTAIKLNLQSIERMPGNSDPRELIQRSIDGVDRAVQSVRALSIKLRPSLLDDLGLDAALRWLLDQTVKPAGIAAEINSNTLNSRLSPDIETACFRIAQEAVTNAVKHAQCKALTINLQKVNGAIEMVIRDDGRGFDVRTCVAEAVKGRSFGLLGMQERAELANGTFAIACGEGGGTTITATFSSGTGAP